MPDDVRKKMLRFVSFKMRDGRVFKIRAYYLPAFGNEAVCSKPGQKLSRGAWIMLNAVSGNGGDKLCQLIHMCRGEDL